MCQYWLVSCVCGSRFEMKGFNVDFSKRLTRLSLGKGEGDRKGWDLFVFTKISFLTSFNLHSLKDTRMVVLWLDLGIRKGTLQFKVSRKPSCLERLKQVVPWLALNSTSIAIPSQKKKIELELRPGVPKIPTQLNSMQEGKTHTWGYSELHCDKAKFFFVWKHIMFIVFLIFLKNVNWCF